MEFIQRLIVAGYISPAVWRLIEIAIYSVYLYLLSAVVEWQVISKQWLIIAILTPILAYVRKSNTDLTK